jgi:hypothetical protein
MAPPGMSFAKSDALVLLADLREVIAAGFEAQCRVLCFGPSPSCDDVQARLKEYGGCCDRREIVILQCSEKPENTVECTSLLLVSLYSSRVFADAQCRS